jgi:hypothetical protein
MNCTQTYGAYDIPLAIDDVTSQECEVCPRAATHTSRNVKVIQCRNARIGVSPEEMELDPFVDW